MTSFSSFPTDEDHSTISWLSLNRTGITEIIIGEAVTPETNPIDDISMEIPPQEPSSIKYGRIKNSCSPAWLTKAPFWLKFLIAWTAIVTTFAIVFIIFFVAFTLSTGRPLVTSTISMENSDLGDDTLNYEPLPIPPAIPSGLPLASSSVPTAAPIITSTSKPPNRTPSSATSIIPSFTLSSAPSYPHTRISTIPPSAYNWKTKPKPTIAPTASLSKSPSDYLTVSPSKSPSHYPTARSSAEPSVSPSEKKSFMPSHNLSTHPSIHPSEEPSLLPTEQNSFRPSRNLSDRPSIHPSKEPTNFPSRVPSLIPTNDPTESPTKYPLTSPSINPSTSLPTQLQTTIQPSILTFYVFADMPTEKDELKTLKNEIAGLADSNDTLFILHLGDFNNNDVDCTESAYESFAKFLVSYSPVPVFVLPGDDEWSACPDPETAFSYWTKWFEEIERHWYPPAFSVYRQVGRTSNFAVLFESVLFIGFTMPDLPIMDETEWSNVLKENESWLQEQLELHRGSFDVLILFSHAGESTANADFFDPLKKTVKDLAIPSLLIHKTDGISGATSIAYNVDNLTRLVMNGEEGLVKVTIDAFKREPFGIDWG